MKYLCRLMEIFVLSYFINENRNNFYMKTKLYIYSQSNYLSRTAIEAKILFAVCLSKKQALTGGKSLASKDKCSKKIGVESAVLHFVFFMIIINKMQQSAKIKLLINLPTDRTFGNRWSRYKEPSKNKAEAYRVYVEHLFLRSDAGDARIFSKEKDVYGIDYGFGLDAPKETEQANPQDLFAYRRNYTWNERNLLTKSSDRNFTVHYRYGDDGQRALKYTDEGRSETLYFNNFFTIHIPTQDQNNPQGLRVHKHIFVGNSRLVTAMTHTDNQGDNEEQKAKRYYYHSDHLGSAQFVTDWKGRQYEHIEYTPYGELWTYKSKTAMLFLTTYNNFLAKQPAGLIEEVAAGLDKLPFRFTGKELDEETGLYYYGARYLDPKYSRWLSGDPALNDYIPKAPIDDEAKKHNENLPGMGGIYNTVNLHVYHYAGNNPVKYVDPDGDKILDVSTTLFQEDGGAEPLGKSNLTISGYGCVLTAYTRIGNAIGISEDITLLSANRTAKNNIFVGENKNLLDRWNSGPKLVNRIGEGSGNMLKFDKSLTDLTLNEYGAALEEYKNSFDTYAVTIRLSSGHTVNMNTDGIIRDNNGNYTIKINNTSNLSTHNAWKPEGMNSDVIDKNVYIERIDVFKVEFNGNFNKNILLPN